MEHTKTPFPSNLKVAIGQIPQSMFGVGIETPYEVIASANGREWANIIITACNNHDKLVKALRGFIELANKYEIQNVPVTLYKQANELLSQIEDGE